MNFKSTGGGAPPLTEFPFVEGGNYSVNQIEHLHKAAEVYQGWLFCGDPTPPKGNESPWKAPYYLSKNTGHARVGHGWDRTENAMSLDGALSSRAAMPKRWLDRWAVGLVATEGPVDAVCIDLDNVVVDGALLPAGERALELFSAAYAEISPSGTGLRVLCSGRVPPMPAGGLKGIKRKVEVGGHAHSFEIYGPFLDKARFVRMTGALVTGTGGRVLAPCQDGIDWVLNLIRGTGAGATRHDNASDSGPGSVGGDVAGNRNVAVRGGPQTVEAVFESLATYRPEVEPGAVLEALMAKAATHPRGKLAQALCGDLKPWNEDHSAADLFIVCEAVRGGAGCTDDAAEVWGCTVLGKRPKFKRKDYRDGTAERAARMVLTDWQKKSGPDNVNVNVNGRADKAGGVAGVVKIMEEAGYPLSTTVRGRLHANAYNVAALLRAHPEARGLIGFDDLAQRMVRLGSWRVFNPDGNPEPGTLNLSVDLVHLSGWLATKFCLEVRTGDMQMGIETAAMAAIFNPLQDRLRELGAQWDGVARLDSWLVDHLHIETDGQVEYVHAVGRRALIAAVARAMTPGCKQDEILTIEGAGGGRKSTAIKVLAEAVLPGVFGDSLHDLGNPVNVVENTDGRWILEMPEMEGVRRTDAEALKRAASQTSDTVRRPWAKGSVDVPRRFVLWATTNDVEYLSQDEAVQRRFWPVRSAATATNPIDTGSLAAAAAQLWGEAFCAWQAGERWIIPVGCAAYDQWCTQRARRAVDSGFDDALAEFLVKEFEEMVPPQPGLSIRKIAEGVGNRAAMDGQPGAMRALGRQLRARGLEKHDGAGGQKLWQFTGAGLMRWGSASGGARGTGQRRGQPQPQAVHYLN